jgi:hypothetical protein
MIYSAPSADSLAKLKQELGLSSTGMAELFGVSNGRQWRKYTGSEREISAQILFFAMARLELPPADVERILDRMRSVGASIDLTPKSGTQESDPD